MSFPDDSKRAALVNVSRWAAVMASPLLAGSVGCRLGGRIGRMSLIAPMTDEGQTITNLQICKSACKLPTMQTIYLRKQSSELQDAQAIATYYYVASLRATFSQIIKILPVETDQMAPSALRFPCRIKLGLSNREMGNSMFESMPSSSLAKLRYCTSILLLSKALS